MSPVLNTGKEVSREAQGQASKITEALISEVCRLIKAGATPHRAARSCGVSDSTFRAWQSREDDPYAEFNRRIDVALSAAVCGAETQVRIADPFKWLLHGPVARDTGDGRGWTRKMQTEISGPAGGPIESRFDFSKLTLEQLHALDAARRK